MSKDIKEDCIDYAYSHDNDVCENQSKWMSRLNDNKRLSQLSIPGTHNSMSLGWGGDIVQTQSKSLQSQLSSGIRFLDIKLAAFPKSENTLKAYDGIFSLKVSFHKILDDIKNFLSTNPTETVFIKITQEKTKENDNTFINLIRQMTEDTKYSNFIYNYIGNMNPSFKELRHKIVILQNFNGEQKWLPYNNAFNIQDDSYIKNNWKLYDKWEKVKAHLNEANTSFSKDIMKGYINYLNGSGGSFPYFVASGQSSPGTKAPLLSTGLTGPAFKNFYADFPRVKHDLRLTPTFFPRLKIFTSIVFLGTNKLTKTYIDKNNPSYVGIVVADFPGQGLINSIINVNKI